MSQIAPLESAGGETAPETIVAGLVSRARAAMSRFEPSDQARVDESVTALAWSLYKPEHARALAEMAVEDTGLGNVADKITKNQRKTFGTLRDLMRAHTVGVNEERGVKNLVNKSVSLTLFEFNDFVSSSQAAW